MKRAVLCLVFCIWTLATVWAQERTFSAHVVDAETGEELPFANVYAGDGVGTLTNIDGNFSLNVEAKTVLLISYMGYEKQQIAAGKLPKVVRLKPLAKALNEVVIMPVEAILKKVETNLTHDYSRRGRRKSIFFYRQLTSTRHKELAEAFIEARDAVNLRELTVLSGQHGRKTAVGLARPLIADMNFHHPLELGPMTEGVDYWRNAARMFYADKGLRRVKRYDLDLNVLYDNDGKRIYAITFTPKAKHKGCVMLTGTLYVDATTFCLLSFDGRMEGMALDVRKDFIRTEVPIELDLHIKYRHTKGYTEVENLSYTMHSGDFTSNALLFNVDGMALGKARGRKKRVLSENMLIGLNDAGFKEILAQHADIVQRTEEESETAENEPPEDLLTTHYAVKGNIEPMTWDISLPADKLGNLTNRLAKIAQLLPQEKVYVHMDNTCYFIGDSIWFSVYLRRTNDDQVSDISGVMYVELLNNDGYLMERQIIDTKNGRGHGVFHINPDWYAGYYELRAYTRWQLNWGVYERKHSDESEYWFINKEMEHRYFRDYEKLYSRVFPVYDAPRKPGQYNEIMTLRELARNFKKDPDKPKLQLHLYPEGGELIEGVPCRVAFEAAYSDGRVGYGEATIDNGKGEAPTVAKVKNRGRGVFEYVPGKGHSREVTFAATNGDKVTAKLPKAEADGVALQVVRRDSVWNILACVAGKVRGDTLGITIMHEGRVRFFAELTDTVTQFCFNNSELECGVNQVTVFDALGRVYADRLFFVSRPQLALPSLTVKGLKEEYDPYEHITLQVGMNRPVADGRNKTQGTISLAVRDKEKANNLYDNASMMAEMLLASEIQGFVPSPDWYFERDDREHREALDLLMMTQGWRRFDWRKMAVRGEWDLTQPDERTPIIVGDIYKYYPGFFYHPKDLDLAYSSKYDVEPDDQKNGWLDNEAGKGLDISSSLFYALETERMDVNDLPDVTLDVTPDERMGEDLENERHVRSRIKGTVRVHAELVPIGEKDGVIVETGTKNGRFRITLPKSYDPAVFFLSASDTAKWKKGKPYEWIQKMPDEWDWRKVKARDGEFSIRVDFPYPRFAKPYNYYQQRINFVDEKLQGARTLDDGTRQLEEVGVRAKRRGYHTVGDSLPAFMIDGYEAYNFALDAGMLSSKPMHILRAFMGDYGLTAPYIHDKEGQKDYGLRVLTGADVTRRALNDFTLDADSANLRRNLLNDRNTMSEHKKAEVYGNLCNIDKYVVYTEYQPRLYGSQRYVGSNLPRSYISICPYADDGVRMFYRDRRYILPGIAWPEEFYHPDYSQRQLPDAPADYRRTLYWNPELQLDAEGKATVTFWNNASACQLSVSAEGVTTHGEVLTNKQ